MSTTTVMPFLYHTKTICRLTRAPNRPFPSLLTRSAGLHSSSRRAAWQPRNKARREGEDVPSYQRTTGTDHIPFELPPDVEIPSEEPEEDDLQSRIDTITPSERRAFKNIFLEIADRGEAPLSAGTKHPFPQEDDDRGKKPEASRFLASLMANKEKESRKGSNINAIMQHAAEHAKQVQPAAIPGLDPMSPLASMYSAADREQALLKFPASLRQAARVAYGVVGGDHSTSIRAEGGQRARMATALADEHNTDPVDAVGIHGDMAKRLKVESDRRAERLRIRDLMLASQTDAELWDVMENEVFTLVKRLGLESELQLKAPKPKRGRKPKGENGSNTGSSKLLNPEIYGPVYPMLLFEGLHLLNTKFSRPSPYIFHVLPRVKDLGLMSYVLGVSTSFYNQLMSIVWERYGDAAGVLNLMEEMRHAGLYFDQQTQTMLRSITDVYQSADKGEQGPFLKKLMGMPEFEPILVQRLKHWQRQVSSSIRQQMLALR